MFKHNKILIFLLMCNLVMTLTACQKDQIHINHVENNHANESKIYIPKEATPQKYSWDEICEYFGKDLSLSALPETFDGNIDKKEYEMYVSSDGEVLFDNIEMTYTGKNGESIRCVVSKGNIPITDEVYSGGESSQIGKTQLYISQVENTYVTTFLYDGIGYNIVAKDVSENEFVDILNGIIK